MTLELGIQADGFYGNLFRCSLLNDWPFWFFFFNNFEITMSYLENLRIFGVRAFLFQIFALFLTYGWSTKVYITKKLLLNLFNMFFLDPFAFRSFSLLRCKLIWKVTSFNQFWSNFHFFSLYGLHINVKFNRWKFWCIFDIFLTPADCIFILLSWSDLIGRKADITFVLKLQTLL